LRAIGSLGQDGALGQYCKGGWISSPEAVRGWSRGSSEKKRKRKKGPPYEDTRLG